MAVVFTNCEEEPPKLLTAKESFKNVVDGYLSVFGYYFIFTCEVIFCISKLFIIVFMKRISIATACIFFIPR